jgi:oligopeptidase A
MQPFLKNDFLFDWSQLRVEAVESDIRAALKIAQENIEKFKALPPAQLDYAKVMLGFENTTRDLSRAWGLVSHLDSVMNSPELRKAYNALLPEVTAFYTALTLDPEIWKIFKAYAATAEAKALTGVRQRFLKEALLDFEENGADLAAEQKARLTEVNARLAEKTQKYSENVLDSTNDWDLFITDEKRLVGLPASALAAAKQSAIAKERPDAWRITLQQPSIFPVLQYGEDASLRQQCWEALTQVGLKGKWDNTSLVAEILALRDEKAQLLGKKHFADFTTARRMARSGDNALRFIEDMAKRIRPKFLVEVEELEAYRAKCEKNAVRLLHPWEFGFYSEKMRREVHGFDDEALRPWFPVDGVIAGMFKLFGNLFSIQVKARDTFTVDTAGQKVVQRAAEPRVEAAPVSVWHPQVRFYEVYDGVRHLGSFYTDWFPRESKRGGAWMNFFRTGGPRPDGTFAPHLGLMCGNFTPPVNDQQALLTHDEVTTVFHEFGHLLHHLLSEVEIESLSGVRVAWDFVELPSQILENWCWEEESLALFARHHQTGEPLPSELLHKLDAAANFRAATTCMRQLCFSKLDLDLHLRAKELKGADLDAHWNDELGSWQPRTTRRLPAMARRFTHLFADATGYAAGYYSYKWAEALEADAFTRFLKEGVLNAKVGRELRDKVLAKGNAEPAEKLFHDFMGRDLDPEAVLVRDGLAS